MKLFARSALLGAFTTVVVTATTLSLEAWAPKVLKALESIGSYHYKPWIYFAPAICALVLTAVAIPKYRSKVSIMGLIFGGVVVSAIGAAAFFIAVMSALPDMRY
jgi:hypothetical protein